jgi:UDP-glucose 4-epimerase
MSGEPLDLFGDDYDTPDGACIRDYVHVDDLAQAHELAMNAAHEAESEAANTAYNLGIGAGSSVREVIRCVERVTGKHVEIRRRARRAGDVPRLVAASELARNQLGRSPRYRELEAIVEPAWAWHRANPSGYP